MPDAPSPAIINRARACFRLASHPATGEGERSAALARGMALIDKYGLDPELFDIPGRRPARARHLSENEVRARAEWRADALRQAEAERDKAMHGLFASVFGACVGCGNVASVGAMCRACSIKAQERTCPHGQHGFCLICAEIDAELDGVMRDAA